MFRGILIMFIVAIKVSLIIFMRVPWCVQRDTEEFSCGSKDTNEFDMVSLQATGFLERLGNV